MNKLIAGWLFAGTLLMCACTESAPEPSLEADKMAAIIADLYIAEAATLGLGGYQRDSLLHAYYQQVFAVHGVTPQQYEENIRIYSNDPETMKEILKKVEETITPTAQPVDTTRILGR